MLPGWEDAFAEIPEGEKSVLQDQINQVKTDLKSRRASVKELETAVQNVDAILNGEAMFAREDPGRQQDPAEKTRKRNRRRNRYDTSRISSDL